MSSKKRVASGDLRDHIGLSTPKKSKLDSSVPTITPSALNFENLALNTPIPLPADRRLLPLHHQVGFSGRSLLSTPKSNHQTKATQERPHRIAPLTIEERIRNINPANFEIVQTKFRGRGVVTRFPIPKNTILLEYEGELICAKEGWKRHRSLSVDDGSFIFFFKYNNKCLSIDATKEDGTLGRLINHAKDGNLRIVPCTIEGKERLFFVSTTDIDAGKELFYNYGERDKETSASLPWLEYTMAKIQELDNRKKDSELAPKKVFLIDLTLESPDQNRTCERNGEILRSDEKVDCHKKPACRRELFADPEVVNILTHQNIADGMDQDQSNVSSLPLLEQDSQGHKDQHNTEGSALVPGASANISLSNATPHTIDEDQLRCAREPPVLEGSNQDLTEQENMDRPTAVDDSTMEENLILIEGQSNASNTPVLQLDSQGHKDQHNTESTAVVSCAPVDISSSENNTTPNIMNEGQLRLAQEPPIMERANRDIPEPEIMDRPKAGEDFTMQEDLKLLEFFTKTENKKRYDLITGISTLSNRSPAAVKSRLKRIARKGVYSIKKKYEVDIACVKRLKNWYH